MISDYRCGNCRHLLFRGSLELLLSKSDDDRAFIEPKCPRCGKINRFAYTKESEVQKVDNASLFEEA